MKAQQNAKALKTLKPKFIEQIYEFCDCEALTMALIILYKIDKYRILNSSLYVYSGRYRLIIKNPNIYDNIIYIKEFYSYSSNSAVEIAITREYGKILIKEKAIEIYGKAFSPRT